MTAQISLYELLNRLDRFGGVERIGQAEFCLWFALLRKSNKLGWSQTFSMTNAELIYTGGFLSEKGLWQARNKLIQMGLVEYEAPPRGKNQAGRYSLNFDLDKEFPEQSANCFPEENTSESLRNQFGITSESLRNQFGNINNNRLDNKDNDDNNDSACEFYGLVSREFGRAITEAEKQTVSRTFDKLRTLCHENASPMMQEAVRRCTANGVTKVAYLTRIVDNWVRQNITCLEQVAQADAEYAASKSNRGKGGTGGGKAIRRTRGNDFGEYDTNAWERAGFSVSTGT